MSNSIQDSQSELDEILNELSFNGINDVSYCPGGHKLEKYAREEAKKAIEAYVTTRVKEAERLARISERKSVALDNYSGHTFSEDTNWKGKFQKFIDNNERRIEALTTTTNGKEG